VIFADLTWENGAFLTEVLKAIISKGYGCRVDAIPGNTVTLEQALANDDVQIFADEWPGRTDVWKKAAAQGKVKAVGHPYDGGTEGWYVPAFVIKGDPVRGIRARAPDLTSVTQLSGRLVMRGREQRQARRVRTFKVLRKFPPRHARGSGLRNQFGLSTRRAALVLLLVADRSYSKIRPRATVRAAVLG
jgi:hypothetical protein